MIIARRYELRINGIAIYLKEGKFAPNQLSLNNQVIVQSVRLLFKEKYRADERMKNLKLEF